MENLIWCTFAIYILSSCISYTFQETLKTPVRRSPTRTSKSIELEPEEKHGFYPQDLENCKLNEIYKVEYYRRYGYEEYVKQNTTIKCICIQERNNETVPTILHYNRSSGLYYRNTICPIPEFEDRIYYCKEYETCRKLYLYNYGALRGNEQYVDAIDDYCTCVNFRKCSAVGYLPQSMSDPYDSVVYYRCEEAVHKEIKLCNPHQVYMFEIHRNITGFNMESEVVKLKSYMTCICHSIETPTFEDTVPDTFDETIQIKIYTCPPVPEYEELSNHSCEDFQICRYGYSSMDGIEAPERSVEVYVTNICQCDIQDRRSCKKAREEIQRENEYKYIYECTLDVDLPQCEEGKPYKTEFYNTRGVTQVKDYIKTRTSFFCKCGRPIDGSRRGMQKTRHYNAHEVIMCPLETSKGVNPLRACDANPEAVCQRDYWQYYGTAHPEAIYFDYIIKECACQSDRSCILSKRANRLLRVHTCRIEYTEPTNAKICEEDAIFKVEFYGEYSTEGKEKLLKKLTTRFFCGCDTHRSFSSPKPTKHPTLPYTWVKDYPCPQKIPTNLPIKPLKSCDFGEICRANYYNEIGSDAPGQLYIDFSLDRCFCDRFRNCTFNPMRKLPKHEYVEYEYCLPEVVDLSKLPVCAKSEVYKQEWHIENALNRNFTFKMDTRLRCQCNPDRHNPQSNWRKHLTRNHILIKEFQCNEIPKKSNPKGFELQMCKREYFYKYGRDREDVFYIDTTEEYCYCPKREGLECRPGAYLPPFEISAFDKVLSYRCMGSVKEKLKPCGSLQLFLLEIHEYTNTFRTKTKKLNSFLKCICETDKGLEEHMKEKGDPNDETKLIRTFLCPRRLQPSANAPCKDYAICQKGHVTDVGEEEPHSNYTQIFMTYCKCDKDRMCDAVGMGDENITIYRCVPKMTNPPTKMCKDLDTHRVDIHHYILPVIEDQFLNHSRIKDIIEERTIKTRLNTFVRCRCLGASIPLNPEDDPNFSNNSITKVLCKISREVRASEAGISYCRRKEMCMTHTFESSGLENPNETFASKFDKLCICTYPRVCLEVERPSRISSIDRCIVSKDLTQKLYVCGPNQLYKDVLYLNGTTSKGEVLLARLNTFLMCECELTVNEKYVENKTVSKDVREEKISIESHYCPRRHVSDAIVRCVDYAVCRKNIYTSYGVDIDLRLQYLNHTILHCNCDGSRKCVKAGKELSEDPLTSIDILRCIPNITTKVEECKDDRLFLAVVHIRQPDGAIRDRMNAFFRCKCNRINRDNARFQWHVKENDTTVPDQVIHTYECPYETPPTLHACKENDECLIEEFDTYGRERVGEKFLLNKYELCKCGEDLLCMKNETAELRNIHRCIRKYCSVGDLCRVEKYSVDKELEESTKHCSCEGACTYRDFESIITSFYRGNETHNYDCKSFDPHKT